MITETAEGRASGRALRADPSSEPAGATAMRPAVGAALAAALAMGFVLIGGGGLELSDSEAHLGLSAHEPFSAVAQVLGGYDPSVAPASAWITALWASLFDAGIPGTGSVRWPSAVAAVGIGLILARRAATAFGPRAGVFAALAWCGSAAMIDRSSAMRLDLLAGVALVASLDRLLSRGGDWIAGLLAALAVMLGGWPALAAILMPSILIGRKGASPTVRLLLPPVVAFVLWSAWTILTTRAEVWAAIVMLPLKGAESWRLGLVTLAAALPWAPVAIVSAFPTIRATWGVTGQRLVSDWMKVAGVGLLAGTLMPGMATAGVSMMLAGLAIAAAPALDRMWSSRLDAAPRRAAAGIGLALGLAVGALAVYSGAHLAAAQPYYRSVGIALIGLGTLASLAALDSSWSGSSRGAVRTLFLVAVIVKVGHWGYYMPESNYRFSKGPWGRAVGQYVPPGRPIYTFHEVSPALALATEHPVHRLRSEIFLKAQPGAGPKYVLLQESEFANWPEIAPRIQKVREFQDEYGGIRVLARTEGPLLHRDLD